MKPTVQRFPLHLTPVIPVVAKPDLVDGQVITRAAQKPAKSKQQLSSVAKRPTFEATPSLINSFRHGYINRSRSRTLLDMLKQARDFNPDVSKAVDNFVTLCNPGYTLEVFHLNKFDAEGNPLPDMQALQEVREFGVRMFSEYSGVWAEYAGKDSSLPGLDAFINMAHLTAATQGAMAAEVELTQRLDDVVDVFPVDPSTIEFQRDPETLRYVPGMSGVGKFIPLDPTRFRYIPKDPDVEEPYGRSPLMAVLDTVFFQQQFMRELQAVAHMTNSPRLDITVVEELANKAIADTRSDLLAPGNEEALQEYLNGFLSDITSYVENLEIDDAFVHYDSVTAQYIAPSGTAIPVDAIMKALDSQIVSATKQLPLLLGRNEGATTTHATVQWQVYIAQLGSYQRISKALVSWLFNLYLRLKGRQSYAVLEYNKHKTSDEVLDANAKMTKVNTWALMVDRGWATNDEAALDLTGHMAVGLPVVTTDGTDESEDNFEDDPEDVDDLEDEDSDSDNSKDSDRMPRDFQSEKRIISESVALLPTWLQRIHFDTVSDYRAWRISNVLPKYSGISLVLGQQAKTLESKSIAGLRRWLYDNLKLDSNETARLQDVLEKRAIKTTEATIQEQLKRLQINKRAVLRDELVIARLRTKATKHSKSVIRTYNRNLKSAVKLYLQDDQRGIDDVLKKLRSAIAALFSWERQRNSWKESQIGMAETQFTASDAITEFYRRNEVDGEAEVFPYYAASADICAEYISYNPYPSMAQAIVATRLPAHFNCPHFLQLRGSASVNGDVWTGE